VKVISLGLGVQSTALYLMSSSGAVERADYAIFSDPGAEHPKTYELLDRLMDWQKKNDGIPIFVKAKNLYKDLLDGTNSTGQDFIPIPAFTESKNCMVRSQLIRQCTNEYKIRLIKNKIRELQGVTTNKHTKPCELWLGISLDEIQRMKKSRMYNITYRYPLLEKELTRKDCKAFLNKFGFQDVIKSSCVFCPYKSNTQWKDLKTNYPKEWDKVIEIDEAIRNSGIGDDKVFLHRSLTPMDRVYLQEDQEELFMCEEGYCGV
jgi:hypothetical protein